jgi:hypothetical protein
MPAWMLSAQLQSRRVFQECNKKAGVGVTSSTITAGSVLCMMYLLHTLHSTALASVRTLLFKNNILSIQPAVQGTLVISVCTCIQTLLLVPTQRVCFCPACIYALPSNPAVQAPGAPAA